MPGVIEAEKKLKRKIPEIRPGDWVLVKEKIKEKDKERTQIFEGLVIARKKPNTLGGKITVWNKILGVQVERIFPLHSPKFEFEVLKRYKVRRAKLYYVRHQKEKVKLKERK